MNIEQKLENTFFNVTKIKEQKLDNETQELKDVFYLVNRETGKKIVEVSDRYTIVHNRDLVKPIVSHFTQTKSIDDVLEGVFNYGNSFFYVINTGRQFEIESGDIVNEQIKIINSYNKTRSFRFMLGALRQVCSNGLIAFSANLCNYKKIHVGEIPISEILTMVLNSYQTNTFDLWRQMSTKPLTKKEQIELINSFCAFEVKKAKGRNDVGYYQSASFLNEQVKTIANWKLDKPDIQGRNSAWTLFNDLNYAIGKSTKDINQLTGANERLEQYLVNELSLV